MNKNNTVHSIEFVKRRAKTLKKELNISHTSALDRVSVEFGFQNYKHFLNQSKEHGEKNKVHISNPHRKLLVAGINYLIQKGHISLDASRKNHEEDGYTFGKLFGHKSVIIWQDIGFEEIRISVWWKYDHTNHPQVNLTGNAKENFSGNAPLAKRQNYKKFVGVVASGWLERRVGAYLQGKGSEGIFETYSRRGELENLNNLPSPTPNNFSIEGRVHM